jgi:ABC-type polysaccharide/polyol phosphate transport system ATPase subunit
MPVAIKVENVSKAYQLGEFTSGTLSRDLERWWALYRGKEDPFLTVGETNDRSVKGSSDIVWSLKDLNFEIQQGDAVGIIGKNGAGKSTLLKVLSQVTAPTTGKIKVKGRIASLLEVGTGFHPELTGRENIYLNGAILGMRKHEIARKFDEIVDFSGVERYLDTPVKRYSSGMYVRLAFAVAAHLESEILVVDEVLAVGDAEFQKKCLGKMGDISSNEGRTILFVSHNLEMVQRLCATSILLEHGGLKSTGKTEDILDQYKFNVDHRDGTYLNDLIMAEIGILKIQITDLDGIVKNQFSVGEHWKISVQAIFKKPFQNVVLASGITSPIHGNLNTTWTDSLFLEDGYYQFDFIYDSKVTFGPGTYQFNVGLSVDGRSIVYLQSIVSLYINDIVSTGNSRWINLRSGVVLNQFDYQLSDILQND